MDDYIVLLSGLNQDSELCRQNGHIDVAFSKFNCGLKMLVLTCNSSVNSKSNSVMFYFLFLGN